MDRAMTMRVAGSRSAAQGDLTTPGHVMPLLVREPSAAAIDASLPEIAHGIVTRSCGYPVAAWCHILNDAGDVASLSERVELAEFLDVEVVVVERGV
jgi:3,4-dihydroxy 2-butanone 4-phosphate synthase / GTP cyclohydrolase II